MSLAKVGPSVTTIQRLIQVDSTKEYLMDIGSVSWAACLAGGGGGGGQDQPGDEVWGHHFHFNTVINLDLQYYWNLYIEHFQRIKFVVINLAIEIAWQ